MKRTPSLYFGMLLMAGGADVVHAATYYVDFVGGSNTGSGISAATPWKHCPGDPNATGNPKVTQLVPGDTVRFKGGVVYRGSMILNWSGNDGNPITYDGNSDGSWGTGKAILDGSAPITTPWTRCTDAADAKGNPHFANIYWTTKPPGVSNGWPQLLADGTTQTHTAQHPNPQNRFLFDVVSEWTLMQKEQITSTTIRDAQYFSQGASSYWSEAWVGIWVQGNAAVFRPITSFDPATDTIGFASVTPYTNRSSYYAVFNHPALIDQPGEHAVSVTDNRLYLWPPAGVATTGSVWSFGSLANAFAGSSKRNVTVKGFSIRGYFSSVGAVGYTGCAISLAPNVYDGTECRNNTFSDNDVKFVKNMDREWLITMNNGNGVKVLRNSVTYCFGGGAYGGGVGTEHSNNTFDTITGTAIYTPGSKNSTITRNTITNLKGTHANGLSIYTKADNVIISYNTIRNAPSLITYENSSNLTFIGNLIDANGEDQRVNDWGGMTGYVKWYGNTLVNNPENRIFNSASGAGAVFILKNNIIDGGGNGSAAEIRSHNIYVGRNWWQSANYAWTLGANEADHTEAALFVRPGSDWSLASNSPAIDRGIIDTGIVNEVDIKMIPRPQNGVVDIGAFEFSPVSRPPAAVRFLRSRP